MHFTEWLHLLCMIIETDTMSDQGACPLPSIIKQQAWVFTLRSVLIRHTTWESVDLPEPAQVVNLKQRRTPT